MINKKIHDYLALMRPANIITAISDILGGIAISGFFMSTDWNKEAFFKIGLLIISTVGLYGGGIVFNDVFDFKEDLENRPERILPSGRVQLNEALILGVLLFMIGTGSATMVSCTSGIIALLIVLSALNYNKLGKHHTVIGPLNMGLCRGGNLLLGMSILPEQLMEHWYIAVVPIVFIAAITLTAQKEVSGNNKGSVFMAMMLDGMVVLMFVGMSIYSKLNLIVALPFLLLWYGVNFMAKYQAYRYNEPDLIRKAVKTGVISLILLNVCYIAGYANWSYAVPVLILLPLSFVLAKHFAVT